MGWEHPGPPKLIPARFFADYDYSLYIDNTVVFKRLPTRADVDGARFRAFRHPWRSSPARCRCGS